MKKRILLTCFGGNVFYEVFTDFQQRQDIELFVSDMNPQVKVRLLTDNFICTLGADHPDFAEDLLRQARANDIRMIIPGGDEEAFALMKAQAMFEDAGIVVAAQDEALLSVLSSKSAQYDYLKKKGFPVPLYRKVKTREEFLDALEAMQYPQKPLIVKPNAARGGRGITILSEHLVPNKDNLSLWNKDLFFQLLDGKTEYLLMEYFEGIVFDVDALCYSNGRVYFGPRKRFNNVTKLFSGNIFENNKDVIALSQKLYETLPTKYLIDYDFILEPDGKVSLLEINPRPSGSTVSYIPFGFNLYYILAKSYLDNEQIVIDPSLEGRHAVTFHKMVGGKV